MMVLTEWVNIIIFSIFTQEFLEKEFFGLVENTLFGKEVSFLTQQTLKEGRQKLEKED